MHKRANIYFWVVFISFCIYAIPMFDIVGTKKLSEMNTVEHGILTASLLACGAVLRHWFRKNQHKFRR
jgi:hypothetical protein